MARPSINAEVDLSDPNADFSEPTPRFILTLGDIYEREPEWVFPADVFDKGGREVAEFGTAPVRMSVAQAKRRGLVKYHPHYRGFIRTRPGNLRGEDSLMRAFDKRQAARAEAKTTPVQSLHLLNNITLSGPRS